MKNTDKTSFSYTYSAPQQEEIKKIREKYEPKDECEEKIDKLRRLDKSAEKPGMIASIILGCIGTSFFGCGMYLSIDVKGSRFFIGIIIGIIGIIGMIAATPLYNLITKKKRQKIAPEILKLADELSENNK